MAARTTHAAYLGIVILGVAGGVVFDGVRRTSTGSGVIPVTGGNSATTSPSTRPANQIRLGIFNIASGVGIDDKYDLGRTEETIRQVNPDVVALQEVRRESGDYPDNAAEIGAKLGMGQAWSPSERRWWRDDFGNGFLSRLPIEGGQLLRIPLPQTQERGHRNATLTRVKVGDATLTILGTHVDRQVDQPAQLAFLRDLFLATPEPAVLMGDMNVTIGNPVVQELIREHGAVEVGPVNDRRIELILVRGAVRRVGAGQLDLHASDHALVWADVEVTGK